MKTHNSVLQSVVLLTLGVMLNACSAQSQAGSDQQDPGATSLEPLSEPSASAAPAASGKTCGGFAGLTCQKGEYCQFPLGTQCGAADQTGTCEPIPKLCSKLYAPVCGCDGKTYSSACVAASHAVSVASRGACSAPTGKLCGGIAGITCPDDQFCDYPPSAKCGAGDMSGTCRDEPQLCTDLYAPVCGCDGKVYPNPCYAARNGVSVAHQGPCKTP